MNKETYEKHLAHYQKTYKNATSMFDGYLEWISIMKVWDTVGTINGYDNERGYRCDLLDKDGNVAGHTLAVPGGIHWEWPQLIMDLWNYEKGA